MRQESARLPNQVGSLVAALLLAAGLTACLPAGPTASPAPTVAVGDERPAPPDAAVLPAARLGGRIIAVSISDDGVANVVRAIDPFSGQKTVLWNIEAGATVSEWRPAPDGLRVAYRRSAYDGSGEDALIVRALEPDAPPLTLAATDVGAARLAGYAWSPGGQAVAFGRETGAALATSALAVSTKLDEDATSDGATALDEVTALAESATEPGGWELHVAAADVAADAASGTAGTAADVAADAASGTAGTAADAAAAAVADRVVFAPTEATVAGDSLRLVGWAPASRRAAVLSVARDGGPAGVVRLFDTVADAQVLQVAINALAAEVVPSPDGRFLAWPEIGMTPRRIRVLELASSDVVDLARTEAGWVPVRPVWSPDSQWLAWTEHPGADWSGAGADSTGAASASAGGSGESAGAGQVAVVAGTDEAGASAETDSVITDNAGAGAESRVWAVRVGGAAGSAGDATLRVTVAGQNSEVVAFNPDGDALLVAVAEPYTMEPSRLSVYSVPGGAGGPLAWALPAGTWRIGWVADTR